MNTVRCIYILEREHLLILVNIWLLFIWYICTYAAVMQLCSEPRWHCFWSHVFALIKQLFISFFFPLSYTDDHKHFMSFYDALSSFFIFWCFTDSISGKKNRGGSKNVLCSLVVFETFQSFFLFFFFSRVLIFSWNMLHTNSRGYDDQSMVCFLAFKLDKSISLTVSYPKSNDVNGVSWLTITVLQLKV